MAVSPQTSILTSFIIVIFRSKNNAQEPLKPKRKCTLVEAKTQISCSLFPITVADRVPQYILTPGNKKLYCKA